MTDKELEKCLLTDEERQQVWDIPRLGYINRLLKAQLTKAIPIIELDAYARGFEQAKFETRLAVAEEIAGYIENKPTDGWDKWYYYQKGLAAELRDKFCGKDTKEK